MPRRKAEVYNEAIFSCRRAFQKSKAPIWKAVVDELGKSRSRRREVNVEHIGRVVTEGGVAIVPGKVLGDGHIGHAVTVGAPAFSREASKKISEAGGSLLRIDEFIKKNIDGKGVILIG